MLQRFSVIQPEPITSAVNKIKVLAPESQASFIRMIKITYVNGKIEYVCTLLTHIPSERIGTRKGH